MSSKQIIKLLLFINEITTFLHVKNITYFKPFVYLLIIMNKNEKIEKEKKDFLF